MLTDSEILTLEELHAYLKIPKPTLYVLAQSGRIPAAKVGRHWRFRKADINEWLNAQKWSRPLQRRTRSRKPSYATPQSAFQNLHSLEAQGSRLEAIA